MRNGGLALVAVVLLGVLLCSGGWSPLALVGAAGTALAKLKVGVWLLLTLGALCAGPLLLLWVFVQGPPERREGASVVGTVVLVVAGIALTVTALLKMPLVASAFALLFLAA